MELINKVSTPIMLLENRALRISFANTAAKDWIGAKAGNIISEYFPDFNEQKLRQKIDAGQSFQIEVSPKNKKGFRTVYIFRKLNPLEVIVEGRTDSGNEETEVIMAAYTKLIEQKNSMIQAEKTRVERLLSNIRQAVFSIDSSLKILSPVSDFSTKLFNRSIVGANIFDVLYNGLVKDGEVYSKLKAAIQLAFAGGEIQWILSEPHLLPKVTVHLPNKVEKDLQINYNPIWDANGNLSMLMFIVEDRTELAAFEKNAEFEKKENSRRMKIIHELSRGNIEHMKSYFRDSNNMILELQALAEGLEKNPNAIKKFRQIAHTFKGNSRVQGYSMVSSCIHHIENEIHKLLESLVSERVSFEEYVIIMQVFVNSIKGFYDEYKSMAEEIFHLDLNNIEMSKFSFKMTEVSTVGLKTLQDEIYSDQGADNSNYKKLYQGLFYIPLRIIFENAQILIGEVSPLLNKKVDLKVESNVEELNFSQHRVISDAVGHILRNSLDHGIEMPEERIEMGKPEIGNISLKFLRTAGGISLTISDDGRGVNLEKVVSIAIGKGLISEESAQKLTEQEKIELIFASSLSTKAQATEISGQGIGMEAIRDGIRALGGEVVVSTIQGRGTQIRIDLASQEVLL